MAVHVEMAARLLDLGELRWLWGIEIARDRDTISFVYRKFAIARLYIVEIIF